METCSKFRNDLIQLARQLRTANVIFKRFHYLQYRLDDSFLKSSKEFIK